MKRLVTLPNGHRVSLGVSVASWNGMLDIMAQTSDALVKGWDDFPIEAAAIRRDLQCGIHDRINRHILGFGHGRKWAEDYRDGAAPRCGGASTTTRRTVSSIR